MIKTYTNLLILLCNDIIRNKYCRISEHTSRVFFSKLNQDTFVQMMLITDRLANLPGNFHKYYALYKFYEFMPWLDIGNSKITSCENVFDTIFGLLENQFYTTFIYLSQSWRNLELLRKSIDYLPHLCSSKDSSARKTSNKLRYN